MGEAQAALIENVRKLAKRQRLSMNRLADAAGVSRGALSDILNSVQSPTLTTLEKLAAALGVPAGKLLLPQDATETPAKSRRPKTLAEERARLP